MRRWASQLQPASAHIGGHQSFDVDDLNDDFDEVSQRSSLVTVASTALRWPAFAVYTLSAAGLVVAAFNNALLSTVTWLVLLFAGCGLLFYRRYDAIKATRSAGGVGAVTIQTTEKIAVGILTLSCLANGVVIALEVASWQFWVDLWGRES